MEASGKSLATLHLNGAVNNPVNSIPWRSATTLGSCMWKVLLQSGPCPKDRHDGLSRNVSKHSLSATSLADDTQPVPESARCYKDYESLQRSVSRPSDEGLEPKTGKFAADAASGSLT